MEDKFSQQMKRNDLSITNYLFIIIYTTYI